MIKTSRCFPILLIMLLAGCGHAISTEIRQQAQPEKPFIEIARNPDAYKGRTVIWGGEVISIENQKDGVTFITLFQKELDFNDAPDMSSASGGRFIIKSEKYLDPYDYRKGRKLTVGGVILGSEIRRVGETDYLHTLVLVREIHLWNESYYKPDPFYYDPFWPHPYYYYPPARHRHHRRPPIFLLP
ncbi:MAG: Slp family lipoprotein [Spirochaetes bacterium]|nr:Slp family lipoprotein [Spirochaetota bacterium]